MNRFTVVIVTCGFCASALASPQIVEEELEATMKVLDTTADLEATIEAGLTDQTTRFERIPDDEVIDDDAIEADADEGASDSSDEVDERNAFSGIQDDFEHDDVDTDNDARLDDEDDFEEDEEVDF